MPVPDRFRELRYRSVALRRYGTGRTPDDPRPRKRWIAAETVIRKHSKRMNVRCGRNLATRELFRRGIARRSDADRLSVYDRQRFSAMRNGQGDVLDESEVDQDGFAGRAPLQDVLRLDVPMDESKGVEPTDADADLQKILRDRAIRAGQGQMFQEFNDHVRATADLPIAKEARENRHRILREDLRLALEAILGNTIITRKDLDRGNEPKIRMLRTVNLAAPAFTDERGDSPFADVLPNIEEVRIFNVGMGAKKRLNLRFLNLYAHPRPLIAPPRRGSSQ